MANRRDTNRWAYFDLYDAEKEFTNVIANFIAAQRKDKKTLVVEQFKGVVRNMYAVTPPMDEAVKYPKPGQRSRGIVVNFGKGKKAGQINILKDLSNAFKQTKKGSDDASGYLKFYLKMRNSRKRMRPMLHRLVKKSVVDYVKNNLFARQGWTPSGWGAAAARFGLRPPQWISRHTGLKGSISMVEEADFMYFEALNPTRHRASKDSEDRLKASIFRQVEAMERWLKWKSEKDLQKKLG
jgi:hypothetical protein